MWLEYREEADLLYIWAQQPHAPSKSAIFSPSSIIQRSNRVHWRCCRLGFLGLRFAGVAVRSLLLGQQPLIVLVFELLRRLGPNLRFSIALLVPLRLELVPMSQQIASSAQCRKQLVLGFSPASRVFRFRRSGLRLLGDGAFRRARCLLPLSSSNWLIRRRCRGSE